MSRTRPPIILAGVWLLASACSGPGVATPMPEPPAFDLHRDMTVEAAKAPEDKTIKVIVGNSGTAPKGAVVRVTNLDGAMPPDAFNVGTDGSFEIFVRVADGEELRFEWQAGSQRSAPADFIYSQPDPAVPAAFELLDSPRFDCLRMKPSYVIEYTADSLGAVILSNDCDTDLTFDNARLRLALPDFTVANTLPVTLPAGESLALNVGFLRSTAGLREDVLLVDVSDGSDVIRYPITLRAE